MVKYDKTLIINTIGLGFEGISSVIVNYLSHMDRNSLMFDFIAQPDIREDLKRIIESSGNIIIIPSRQQNTREYLIGLNNVLKNRYDVIHIRGNSEIMAVKAILAKIHHIKRIIVHSQGSKT